MGLIESNNEEDVDGNLCKLIAWLSVCVLAAAWGSNLDPQWRPIWREFGAFGLISAVGLDVARKVHSVYRRRSDQRSFEGQLARRVATELFNNEAPKYLHPTIERLFADFDDDGKSRGERRIGTAAHPPAHLFALDPRNPAETNLEVAGIEARIRNISLAGLGLIHAEPLSSGPYVLTYEARSGENLVVGIEVAWCRPTGDGDYISGSRFVEFSRLPAHLSQAEQLQPV